MTQIAQSEADGLRDEVAEALSTRTNLETRLQETEAEVIYSSHTYTARQYHTMQQDSHERCCVAIYGTTCNCAILMNRSMPYYITANWLRPSMPDHATVYSRTGCIVLQVFTREEELQACEAKLARASAEVRNVKQLLSASLQPCLPTKMLPKLISLDRIAAAASSRGDTLGFAALRHGLPAVHRRSASELGLHQLSHMTAPQDGQHSRLEAGSAGDVSSGTPPHRSGSKNSPGSLIEAKHPATNAVANTRNPSVRESDAAATPLPIAASPWRSPLAGEGASADRGSQVRHAAGAAADNKTAVSRLKGMLRRPAKLDTTSADVHKGTNCRICICRNSPETLTS